MLPARRGHQPARETAKRKRLQHHVSRSRQRRVEKSFAAEKRVAESADELDVVVDRLRHRDDASRIDAQLLARREIELEHVAARVQKYQSLSADLLQQKSFAAEQPCAESLRERDGQIDVADRTEVRVALRKNRVSVQ